MRSLVFILVAVLFPGLAHAQSLGADVVWASRATWRGLSRTSQSVLQPSIFAALERPSWELAVGGWWNVELSSARDDDHTLVGVGRSGVGESDYWAQAAWLVRGTRLTAGVQRFSFPSAPRSNAITSRWNTTETYARGEFDALGIDHELAVYADVDRVRGAFVEYTANRMLPLFPVRLPPTLVLTAKVGASINQSVQSGSLGYYSHDGFRYADISLGTMPTTHLRALPIAIGARVHYQFARDDAPVPLGSPPLGRALWAELTISVPGASKLSEK